MDPSPNTVALDVMRVLFAAVLCLAVPFVALYAAFAFNSGAGLFIGAFPLGGALLLLGTAQWPEGTRVGVTLGALFATIVYAVAVVSYIIQGIAT